MEMSDLHVFRSLAKNTWKAFICAPVMNLKVKVKSLYLTSVVPSLTRLVSMEADGAPFTPLPLSVLRFTGIQSHGYTEQRKVETDVRSRKIDRSRKPLAPKAAP